MAGIQTRLNRTEKALGKLDMEYKERIQNRIIKLGYDPTEVLRMFPIDYQAAKSRLLVFLEYEEIASEYPMELITEAHYACAMYPLRVISYIHYLLDKVGIPPLDEIDVYRNLIVERYPELLNDFRRLEDKWRSCADDL